MNPNPDLTTFPGRIRYAIGVLGEIAEYLDLPSDSRWDITDLGKFVNDYERTTIVDELAGLIDRSTTTAFHSVDARVIAEILVDHGWRKAGDQ